MLQIKTFILECGTINRLSTTAISLDNVSTMDDNIWDYSVETAILEVQVFAQGALSFLSGAKGTEIFSCFRNGIREKFTLDSPTAQAIDANVEIHMWPRAPSVCIPNGEQPNTSICGVLPVLRQWNRLKLQTSFGNSTNVPSDTEATV
jgi:hypothetical protein